jgi:hypothetical protein
MQLEEFTEMQVSEKFTMKKLWLNTNMNKRVTMRTSRNLYTCQENVKDIMVKQVDKFIYMDTEINL